jgi:excisionase family DNA binding protein
MTSQKYLSIKEAASLVGKSPKTVRRAIRKGDLSAKLVGGKYEVLTTSLALVYGLDLAHLSKQPTQELDHLSKQPTQNTSQTADLSKQPTHLGNLIEVLIEVLKGELKAKDEQLRAKDKQLEAKDEQLRAKDQQRAKEDQQIARKDEQIARLMQTLQAQQLIMMELTKRLQPPALESQVKEPTPPAPPAKAGKGFWATVRKRFGRS